MEKIAFRKLQESDLSKLLDYANNLSAENTFVQLSGEKITEKEEKAFIQKRLLDVQDGNSICLVGEIGSTLVAIGRIDRLKGRSAHVGELHISVAKSARGKGVGYALLTELLKQATLVLGLRMVVLYCFETNISAIKLYKKVGFQLSGVVPEMLSHNNNFIGQITMYVSLV